MVIRPTICCNIKKLSFAYAMCVWFRIDLKINTDYFSTSFNEWSFVMNMDSVICEVRPRVLHITETEVSLQEVILVQMFACKSTCPKRLVGIIMPVEVRQEDTNSLFAVTSGELYFHCKRLYCALKT